MPCPPPGDLSDSGIELLTQESPATARGFFTAEPLENASIFYTINRLVTHIHSHTASYTRWICVSCYAQRELDRVHSLRYASSIIHTVPTCTLSHTHTVRRTAYAMSLSLTHTHIHTHTRTRYTTLQSQQRHKQFLKYLRTQVQGMSPNPSGPMLKACTTQPASPPTV